MLLLLLFVSGLVFRKWVNTYLAYRDKVEHTHVPRVQCILPLIFCERWQQKIKKNVLQRKFCTKSACLRKVRRMQRIKKRTNCASSVRVQR
jgi:hypothetical protein